MHAPHVVNPPTVLSDDDLVAQFAAFLDETPWSFIPCTCGPIFKGAPTPGDKTPCGAPAMWVQRKPCGHAGYACDPHHDEDVADVARGEVWTNVCRTCLARVLSTRLPAWAKL